MDIKQRIQIILGQCIGHGYNDHAKGLENPNAECTEFFDNKMSEIDQLLQESIREKEEEARKMIGKALGDNPVILSRDKDSADVFMAACKLAYALQAIYSPQEDKQ